MNYLFLFVTKIVLVQSEQLRVAFGSCFYTKSPNTPIFQRISEFKPDIFVWMGDSAYVDRMEFKRIGPASFTPETNGTHLDVLFNITKNHPDYVILRNTTRIEGIWDDHDYNQNDGDRFNPTKELIRQKYLNFLDVEMDSQRRTNENGIYHSFVIGNKVKVHVILLDVRWNRDPEHSPPDSEILGEAQWVWLEQELKDSSASIILLVSGSQIIQDNKPSVCETWFESERQRLYQLIKKQGKKVLLLTGDVHIAELTEHPCGIELTNQRIHEITSSGISYSWQQNFIIQFFEFFCKIIVPYDYSSIDDRYIGINFGALTIDEEKILVEIRNYQGLPVLTQIITFSSLEHKNISEISTQCQLHQSTPVFVKFFKTLQLRIKNLTTLPVFKWILFFALALFQISVEIIKKIRKFFSCSQKSKQF